MVTVPSVVYLGRSHHAVAFREFLESAELDWRVRHAAAVDEEVLQGDDVKCIVCEQSAGHSIRDVVSRGGEEIPVISLVDASNAEAVRTALEAGVAEWLPEALVEDDPDILADRIRRVSDRFGKLEHESQLERVNSVIGRIHRELVRVREQSTLERRVCEILADSEPYRFAWIAENDPETKELQPRASAGMEQSYLDDIVVTTDETATGNGPGGTAFRTRSVAVVQNIDESETFEPWRKAAAERGYKSVAAIPMLYREELHGILAVYSSRPFAFDDEEIALLESVASDLAFAIDSIANRKRVERYSELTEHAPVGIYRTEAVEGGRIIEANPALASIFEAESVDDLVGHRVEEFYADPSERTQLMAKLSDERVLQEERRLRTLEGNEVWAMLTEIYYEDADGNEFFDGALTDITQRKKYERRLREQNDLLEERNDQFEFFNDLLRHEVLNGMSVITGNADRLADEWPGDDCPSMIDVIRTRSQDIVDIVRNVRQVLDRLTDESFELEEHDLVEVVAHRVRYLESLYPEATVTLSAPASAPVLADDFLGDVLDNLLKNAVQHNDSDDPSVAVSIERDDEATTLCVADDGPGITDERKAKLFEPTEVPLDTAADGFGLYFVGTMLSRYGGSVDVRDNEPHGTAFELRFQQAGEEQFE
jgi:PAS domain S-box-containing protein